VVDTSKAEGVKEGVEKRNVEIAKELKKNGVSIEIIIKSTGLSEEEVNSL